MSSSSSYRFAEYQIDPRSRRLLREGSEIGVEPRVFDVVVYLIEQRQRAVGRDELIAAAWGRVDSSDATLAQAILKARRLFGDDGSTQHTIRTVARFGYQWVAETETCELPPTEPVAAAAEFAPVPEEPADLHDGVVYESAAVSEPRPSVLRRVPRLAIAASVFLLVATLAFVATSRAHKATSATESAAVIPGLILVAPARVHSALTQDGWMRLGLMAMGADALRSVPEHDVVPNETALAANGTGNEPDIARLRSATGAAIVITIDARRDGERWQLDATLNSADGTRQSISAEAIDAVAAGGALAERLRGVFDASDRHESATAPDVLALGARMQAAILEGHADHALALSDAAGASANAPEIIVLRAKAMNRLGRAPEAITALQNLIARAGTTTPPWLAAAQTTLGYSELVAGRSEQAEADLRRGLAVAGTDRVEAGRAWRGLGNAQAALGDYDEAEASYLRARFELEGSSDRLLLTHILDDLGSIAARRGRFDEAIERFREAATAAAALGATEIEIGARMNAAGAQQERLQHTAALESWRELVPRVRAMSYPSMQRYAAVHYADALAETGAFAQAASELDDVTRAPSVAGAKDALEDVALDLSRARLEIGDSAGAAASSRALSNATVPARALAANALLLEAEVAAGKDDEEMRKLAATLADGDPTAEPGARAEALLAAAEWQAKSGDAEHAELAFRAALALARDKGSPRELRDVAVPYAAFEMTRGHADVARTIAALVDPYATDDFAITLLLARLAVSERQGASAGHLYAQAHALAGERWTSALAAEASEAESAPQRTLAHAAIWTPR